MYNNASILGTSGIYAIFSKHFFDILLIRLSYFVKMGSKHDPFPPVHHKWLSIQTISR